MVLLLTQYVAQSSRCLISPLSSRLIIALITSGEKWLRSTVLHHISIRYFLILFSHLHLCIQNGWYLNTKHVYYWLVKSLCGKRFDYIRKFRCGVRELHEGLKNFVVFFTSVIEFYRRSFLSYPRLTTQSHSSYWQYGFRGDYPSDINLLSQLGEVIKGTF